MTLRNGAGSAASKTNFGARREAPTNDYSSAMRLNKLGIRSALTFDMSGTQRQDAHGPE